ncbi:3'5'-cyclic nucleotide phosphodiesterase [Pseudoscourfieldia marina]
MTSTRPAQATSCPDEILLKLKDAVAQALPKSASLSKSPAADSPQALSASAQASGERSGQADPDQTCTSSDGQTWRTQDIVATISSIDSWDNFDIFALRDASGGHELELTALAIFQRHALVEKFKLDVDVTIRYFHAVASAYRDNPYHNSTHAADVLQSTHVLLTIESLRSQFTDFQVLAMVLAAMVHDIGHPGYNNPFLVARRHELALQFNDQSVNEHYHALTAFEIMRSDESCNLMSALSDEHQALLERTVVDIVLKTDMAVHGSIVETFTEYVDKSGTSISQWDDEGKQLACSMMVHLADLTNVSRPTRLGTQWGTRVVKEMWLQGDEEKRNGMVVTPICDREKTSVASAQLGFCNFVVTPMLDPIGRVIDVGWLKRGVDAYVAHYEAELAS